MTPRLHIIAPTTETPLAVDLFCGLGGWTDGLITPPRIEFLRGRML